MVLYHKWNSVRYHATCTLWVDLSENTHCGQCAQALLTFSDRERKKLKADTHVKRQLYIRQRRSIIDVLSRSLLLCCNVALAVEDTRSDTWH